MSTHREVLNKFIELCKEEGLTLSYIDDGVGCIQQDMLNYIFEVDECFMIFRDKDGKKHWALPITCNDPEEIIADYSGSSNQLDRAHNKLMDIYPL